MNRVARLEGGFKIHLISGEHLGAELEKDRPFLGVTLVQPGRISFLGSEFLIQYRNGRVIVFDSARQAHEMMFFHFIYMKTPRWWRGFDPQMEIHEFSFTPYGYEPLILSANTVNTFKFKFKCFWHLLPSRGYRFIRKWAPDKLVEAVKKIRCLISGRK